MWPAAVYGVAGLVTFVDEGAGGCEVLIDPPWTANGMHVGRFRDVLAAVGFVYGPPAVQQPLPLEWP